MAWAVYQRGPWRYSVGGWGAPLGIDLYVDGLSAVMLLMTATVGLLVSIYADGAFTDDDRRGAEGVHQARAFWPLWCFALAALNGLYLAADVFNLYVMLEVSSIASVGLVVMAPGTAALVAGIRYLLVAFAGSTAYLMGVALLYADGGTLDLYALGDNAGPALPVSLALMSVGLLMKSGFFPLHFWLPPAHASAPSMVSPLLSGLIVKASLYLLIRLWVQALPPAAPGAATLLGVLAIGGIVWCSVAAFRQQALKPLIAYSTVAQLGYVGLLIPLAVAALGRADGGAWGQDAWFGAAYLAVSDGFAKAAMFMAAGLFLRASGTDRMALLGGITDAMPLVSFAFGAAAFTLLGLPPSGGFAGKWHLLTASLEAGEWLWAAAIAGGTLLTAGYLLRATGMFFRREPRLVVRPVPGRMKLVTLVMALLSIALGMRTGEAFELLSAGSPLQFGG